MSAPLILSDAQRDGHDDSPVRCVDCGLYSYDDEVRHTATRRGPVCEFCEPIDDREAA